MVESIRTTSSVPRTPPGFSSRVWDGFDASPCAKGWILPFPAILLSRPLHTSTQRHLPLRFHLEALLRLRQIQSGELEAALIELTTARGVMLESRPSFF